MPFPTRAAKRLPDLAGICGLFAVFTIGACSSAGTQPEQIPQADAAAAATADAVAAPDGSRASAVSLNNGLSLVEFVRAVQTQSAGIRTARNELQIAAEKVAQETSIFEPKQFSRIDMLSSKAPLSMDDRLIGRQPDPYPTDRQELEAGVSALMQNGSTISLTSRATRLRQGLDTDYAIDGFVGLSITAPLARGRGADFVMAGIRAAEIDRAIADLSVTDRANALAAQAAFVFLDGLRAQQTIENLGKRVAVLEDLLASSDRLISEGRLPPSARHDIENSIDQIRALRSEREQEFRRYQADLLTLLGQRVQSSGQFRLVEAAIPETPRAPCTPGACLDRALAARMDYQAQVLREQKAEVEIRRAANVAQPRVDLTVELGMTEQGADLADAFAVPRMIDNPTARIGLEMELPLRGNRYGAALQREADLQLENERIRTAELRLQIENEIMARRAAVAATADQLKTWRDVLLRNKAQLAIETGRFDQGRSDVMEILRAQERALDAEATVNEARIAHAKAWIMLRASQGALESVKAGSDIFNSRG